MLRALLRKSKQIGAKSEGLELRANGQRLNAISEFRHFREIKISHLHGGDDHVERLFPARGGPEGSWLRRSTASISNFR